MACSSGHDRMNRPSGPVGYNRWNERTRHPSWSIALWGLELQGQCCSDDTSRNKSNMAKVVVARMVERTIQAVTFRPSTVPTGRSAFFPVLVVDGKARGTDVSRTDGALVPE